VRPFKNIGCSSFCGIFTLLALLAGSVPAASAQHTETKDAGGGRKIELHYNAAGQVTETRTLGPDGKVLEKDLLEYPPGAYIPHTISTSYWPNGQPHKITRNTYDNNSNFTGEFIQVFDESGKQIGGHELKHDPQTNVYHCADWNVAAQAYKTIECPAAEESSGAPETVKQFTAAEVLQQLAQAREAAKLPSTPVAAAPEAATSSNVKEVGLILPAHIHPGDRISGSVVEDPGRYEGEPAITVTRIPLPLASSGAAASLAGWQIVMSGEPPQQADAPFVLTVPPGQPDLAVMFRQAGGAGAPLSKLIPLPQTPAKKSQPASSFQAPAICVKGQLCAIHGPFHGDASKTFAAFETRPATVIAETAEMAYLAIPERTEAGPRPLVIAEGNQAVAFPMVVAEFTIPPDRRDLPQGEKLLMYPTVSGPEELPDPAWRPGNYPAYNLDEARKLIPSFQPPAGGGHEKREAREKEREREKAGKSGAAPEHESEENEAGEILLVVKNLTPEMVNFRDSQNGTYVFHLHANSFHMGEFKYKFVVEGLKTGNFGVRGYVIPFLAPVQGQEFLLTTASKPQ